MRTVMQTHDEVLAAARAKLEPHAHRPVRALLRSTANDRDVELEAALWDVVYSGVVSDIPERVAWRVQRELEADPMKVQRLLDGAKPDALRASGLTSLLDR